jgi:DNA (cytosine-5)-methyltransferase 1
MRSAASTSDEAKLRASILKTSVRPRDTQAAAKALAIRAAGDLDAAWEASKRAPEGPFDVVDMFSGAGGMSTGFAALNGILPAYRLAMAVDVDRDANASYERNLGMKPMEFDVGALARDPRLLHEALRKSRRREGNPLVLIGCAPCQGFSSHRNAPTGDPRNSLFVKFAEIAAHLYPEAVVVENVPELLTDRYWPYLQRARRILVDAGYHVHVGIHNMATFGVPQERFRVLLLAMRRPFKPPTPFLARGKFRTVRDAVEKLPRIRAGEMHAEDAMHYTAGHRESTIRTIRTIPKDGGSLSLENGPACLRRIEQRQGRSAYEDVYGRLAWDRPAITITAYSRNPASGRYVHPEQDRGLSVREAALLQGFPRDYWFKGSLDERFRQVGNAVPPTFAIFLAAHLLGELLAKKAAVGVEATIERPVGPSFSRLIPALKRGFVDLASLSGS